MFGDTAVHFLSDYLGLLFRPKLLSSVRPRDFARECFFLFFTVRNIFREFADLSRTYLGRVCPRTVRASFFLFLCFLPEPNYLESC